MEQAEQYLRDFGLIVAAKSENELFMRGTGTQPYIYRASQVLVAKLPWARLLGPAHDRPREAVEGVRPSDRDVQRARWRVPSCGSSDPQGVAVDVLHGFTRSQPLPTSGADPL